MAKYLIALCILLVSLLAFSPAQAKVVKLTDDTLYVMGFLYFGDGDEFEVQTLSMLDHGIRDIDILINSPGGASDDMFQILNHMGYLQRFYCVTFTTINMEQAASAAAYIWLAGDIRAGVQGCEFMFHTVIVSNGWGVVPWEVLPQEWKDLVHRLNADMAKWILDRTGRVDWLIAFLQGGYNSQNWFAIADLKVLGVPVIELR